MPSIPRVIWGRASRTLFCRSLAKARPIGATLQCPSSGHWWVGRWRDCRCGFSTFEILFEIAMNPARSILLAASQNAWLRDHAASHTFVRRAVSRFMPGEELSDALAAAQRLQSKNIGAIFTRLGENITDQAEA